MLIRAYLNMRSESYTSALLQALYLKLLLLCVEPAYDDSVPAQDKFTSVILGADNLGVSPVYQAHTSPW